jgi:hypothetical protein
MGWLLELILKMIFFFFYVTNYYYMMYMTVELMSIYEDRFRFFYFPFENNRSDIAKWILLTIISHLFLHVSYGWFVFNLIIFVINWQVIDKVESI